MAPQNIDDARKQAEFDRLMTAARVHRMRGDYKQAEQTINQALVLCPSDIAAQEFAADMLCARGELEKAAAEYKRLIEQDKTRASIEDKYARAMLQIAEGKRQKDLLQYMLDNPGKYRPPARNPLIAAIISVAPGFGQMYCGKLTRGIVLCSLTMLSWLVFYLLAPNTSDLVVKDKLSFFLHNLDPLAILFACFAFAMHVFALVEAAVLAGKSNEKDESGLA